MFGNPTDKNTDKPNNNTTPSFFNNPTQTNDNKPQAGSALFGANNSAGLFGNVGGSGLFSTAGNAALKTTERKQGGLFGSITGAKTQGDEAPKLNFGGISAPSITPIGGLFGSNIGTKKQQPQAQGSMFPKPAGSLFSTSTPSGGLFGQPKQQTPQGGLFSGTTPLVEPRKQEKPQGGLFGGVTSSSALFGGTQGTTPGQGGMFGGDKKEGGLFGPSTAESTMFSKPSQPTPFSGTLKQEKKQVPSSSGGLFGNTTVSTPSGGLFGSQQTSTPVQQSSEAPKFSLGNTSSTIPAFGISGGLFGSSSPLGQPKPASRTDINFKQQQKPEEQKPATGLFGGVTHNFTTTKPKQEATKPKEDATKATVTPMFGSSGLLGAKDITKQGDTGAVSGLFGKVQKKQTAPVLTPVATPGGSLFGQNKQQAGKKQTKQAQISLFQSQANSLFGSKTQQQKPDKPITTQQQSPLFPSTLTDNKSGLGKETGKVVSQKLLQTFQKDKQQKSNEKINNLQQAQQGKRDTRTISFNEASGEKVTGGKIGEDLPDFKPYVPNRQQNTTQGKDTVLEGVPKPPVTTSPQPSQQHPRVPQQSFFKAQQQQQPPQLQSSPLQKVFTSHQLTQLLSLQPSTSSQQFRKYSKPIQQWISLSFNRSNEMMTSEMRLRRFKLHENEDINRFLNDLFREVVEIVNLPVEEKSFILINQLFQELLIKLDIKEFLFKCTKVNLTNKISQQQLLSSSPQQQQQTLQIVQLNSAYFLKHQIYKFTPQSINLNLDSTEVQRYIMAMTKKFITNQLEYIEFLQSKIELLQLPHTLFFNLLKYSLTYNKSRTTTLYHWNQRSSQLISILQDFQTNIINKITQLLQTFTNQNFYAFLLINKQLLPQTIKLLENFSYTEQYELISLTLKVILNGIDLSSPTHQPLNPQIKAVIKQTKSLQLLPFRTLISCIQPNQQYRPSPSAHDLYRYISGPEWLDWLQLYLTNGISQQATTEKQVSTIEARYMIKILAYPSLGKKRINRSQLSPKQMKYLQNLQKKILQRKRPIYKFIVSLKEENMLDIFYLLLTSLIYDYESYRRISETFFRQKDEFSYEFRTVVAEICNYPVQQFKEEIPFLEEKILYFLRVCEVTPQRAMELERLVFDGVQVNFRSKETSQVDISDITGQSCHRLCHLVIDTITYFSLRQNQTIISRYISTIKSLLEQQATQQQMKLAMSINKPQLAFITNSSLPLSHVLVKEMIQLLEYFLTSEEWTQMLATKMKTSNWENCGLEKYYTVRYSTKDYSIIVREVIGQEPTDLLSSPLVLTHSSYWLLRCLQVLVRGFRQQQSASTKKTLLFTLNLIVQKLFMPMSHNLPISQTQMLEQQSPLAQPANNPIYTTSSATQTPKILYYLIEALNSIQLFQLLEQNLAYTLMKSGQVIEHQTLIRQPIYSMKNVIMEESYEENQFVVYLTVRLLKKLLLVYRSYEQYKNGNTLVNKEFSTGTERLKVKRGESHFVYKLLNTLKWMTEIQCGLLLNAQQNTIIGDGQQLTKKTNIIVGLVTLLIQDQQSQQSSQQQQSAVQTPAINLKQQNYERPFVVPIAESFITSTGQQKRPQLSSLNMVQKFYSQHGEKLNFQVINDFMVNTQNKYLESYESLETLCCETLGLMIGYGEGLALNQQSINLVKSLGFYSDSLNPTIPSTWLTEHLQQQLLSLLSSSYSSIQLKYSILTLLHQLISTATSASFIIAKKIFYKYLPRHVQLRHEPHQMNRLNLTVVKIINLLQEKDPYVMKQQYNDRFIDSLLQMILISCETIIKPSNSLIKTINSFKAKQHYPSQLAYYHLERACEQRELVNDSDVYEILREVISLIEKRFFDTKGETHKWKAIRRVNAIIIDKGLAYLTTTIVDSGLTIIGINHVTQQNKISSRFNTSLPRCFIINPLQHFITTATKPSHTEFAFTIYKQNIIDWVSFKSIKLGQSVLKFLNWTLTIDKTLFGNQPIAPKSRQLSCATTESVICSAHMGSYKHTGVELFAETELQGVNLVKTLFDMSFRRLEEGMSVSQQQCFTLMGYCLQWLRARSNSSQVLHQIVKSTIKHSFWLDSSTVKNRCVIKFLLSIITLCHDVMLDEKEYLKLRVPVLEMVHKFMRNKTIVEEAIVQQLVSVLIAIPPLSQDSVAIGEIVAMWKGETNNEYFYNQSRLILEIAEKSPLQLAKLKPLTTCEKLRHLTASTTPEYNYNLRHPDTVTLTWGFKIASMLMSTEQQSIIIFEQVKEFFTAHQQFIYQLLLTPPQNINLVYVQQLQALLQFLSTLVSSQSWLTVERIEFQKLTYLLSHKMLNFVVDYIGGRVKIVAVSDMEKKFRKMRFETLADQITNGNNVTFAEVDFNSIFRLLTETKMYQLINTFILLLTQCFHQSHYIHKYFNQEVYDNYRYGVSFWDRMNKSICDIIKFSVGISKKYKRTQNLNQKLLVLEDSINSGEFFVESGYLSSLYCLPTSPKEQFTLINELITNSLSLGNVHLIQSRTFRQKYQCLMKGNIQKFAKKLMQNVKIVQSLIVEQEENSLQNGRRYYERVWRNLENMSRNV